MINIFEYLDYRDFLIDYVNSRSPEEMPDFLMKLEAYFGWDSDKLSALLLKSDHINLNDITELSAIFEMTAMEETYLKYLVKFAHQGLEKGRQKHQDQIITRNMEEVELMQSGFSLVS